MRLEYVPYAQQPEIRFEFEIKEILSYLMAHIAHLKSAPENHSPHKQIVRDYQERIQPFLELQAKIQQAIEQGQVEVLTWADLEYRDSTTYLVANLLEHPGGTVICPACQDVYSSTELVMYDWTAASISGRLFTCPRDHELLKSNERFSELMIPMKPFERTLRKRQAKI